MEGDSAGPSRKPSSQLQHAIYKLEMMFPMQEGATVLDELRTGARTLLGRDVKGGTENPLRALVAIGGSLTASRGANSLLTTTGTGPSLCTIAVLAAPPVAPPVATMALITLIIIYDGAGRLKASVKRSLWTLLAGHQGAATFSAALQVLEAWSAASAMSFVDDHPSNVIKVEWRGGIERDLIDYLKERVATDNQTPLMRTSNSALLACSGMDMLGPHSRKRVLMLTDAGAGTDAHQPSSQRGGSSSSALLASPTKVTSAPSARPPEEALATLLSWSGELTAEEATRRANGLLELIQKTMEENAVYKIANAGTLDSRKVRARASLPSCPLSCLQLS